MKVQAHISVEPPLEYNQDETPLMSFVCYDLLNHLGSYKNIIQFQISSARENRQRDQDYSSLRLEFLEKFLTNKFALSDAEGNTSRSLKRVGIADFPLLNTLLAICQKSRSQVSVT